MKTTPLSSLYRVSLAEKWKGPVIVTSFQWSWLLMAMQPHLKKMVRVIVTLPLYLGVWLLRRVTAMAIVVMTIPNYRCRDSSQSLSSIV